MKDRAREVKGERKNKRKVTESDIETERMNKKVRDRGNKRT